VVHASNEKGADPLDHLRKSRLVVVHALREQPLPIAIQDHHMAMSLADVDSSPGAVQPDLLTLDGSDISRKRPRRQVPIQR
jgi:hypothetical protein